MGEAKAYGRDDRTVVIKGHSNASPEDVFDLLSDLRSHLEWGGNRQYKMFRLLSLDAPATPAQVGDVFTSTGNIPMTSAKKGHWENTTTVTKAERPALFETRTEGRIPWSKGVAGEGTFDNRFEITPDGKGGSNVTYRAHQLRFLNPPWGLRYPLMREVTYRMWIPAWYRKGFKNMLKMAAERVGAKAGR
jgi:hypothetical protein